MMRMYLTAIWGLAIFAFATGGARGQAVVPNPQPDPTPAPRSGLLDRLYPDEATNPLRSGATPRAIADPATIGDVSADPAQTLQDLSSESIGVMFRGDASLQAQMASPALPPQLILSRGPNAILPTALDPIPQPVVVGIPAVGVPAEGVDTRLDINLAGAEELMDRLTLGELPGSRGPTRPLDARRARSIIHFRDVHGPFLSPSDLAGVAGISDAQALQWESDGLIVFRP